MKLVFKYLKKRLLKIQITIQTFRRTFGTINKLKQKNMSRLISVLVNTDNGHSTFSWNTILNIIYDRWTYEFRKASE